MKHSSDALRGSRALRTLTGLTLMACAFTLSACDDDDDFVSPNILEGVTTFVDGNFDFGALRTFAMPDTIVYVHPLLGDPAPVTRQFDRAALDRVKAHLVARGYVEVDPATTKPDFVVLMTATASSNNRVFVEHDDTWYPQWSFYNWSWYQPGFTNNWVLVYPYGDDVAQIQFNRGTLVVDLVPTLTVNPLNQTVTSKWAGLASAVIDQSITQSTVEAAIDEMFAQSPYLRPVAAPAPLAMTRPSLTDALARTR